MTRLTRAAAVLLALVLVATAAPAVAAPAGPALEGKRSTFRAALTCVGDVEAAERPTVLLVHGTATNARETWGTGLAEELPRAGYPTCWVDLPDRALNDVQVSVEYVVWAIRDLRRRSGQKVAVVGHSQGAFLATYALRFWPDLGRKVSDVVGYSGAYTYGTDLSTVLCALMCTEAFAQFRPGSRLLQAVARQPLPPGPDYTAMTSLTDEIVLPQPTASTLEAPGARTYVLQDLCPLDVTEHVLSTYSRPFLELTLDALDHRGPARAERIGRVPCGLVPGTARAVPALITFGLGALLTASGHLTTQEPRLRCYLDESCQDG